MDFTERKEVIERNSESNPQYKVSLEGKDRRLDT